MSPQREQEGVNRPPTRTRFILPPNTRTSIHMDDEQDYIAMLERTQIPEDHPLIRHLFAEIGLMTIVVQFNGVWPEHL